MIPSSAQRGTGGTQPLSDILPWGPPIFVNSRTPKDEQQPVGHRRYQKQARTLLVTDATSTDGRFLLHTLALQFLSSRYNPSEQSKNNVSSWIEKQSIKKWNGSLEGSVLWISCGPTSERQIYMALRKAMQANLGGSSGSVGEISKRMNIVSVPLELADAALGEGNEEFDSFSEEGYLKQLYKRISHWLYSGEFLSSDKFLAGQRQEMGGTRNKSKQYSMDRPEINLGPNLVIIDNVTLLSTQFGSTLTNVFLSSVRSASTNHATRCTDFGQSNEEVHKSTTPPETRGPISETVPLQSEEITSINLFSIRCASPDDGGLYSITSNEKEQLRSEYSRLLRPWVGMGSGISSYGEGVDGVGESLNDILQTEEIANDLSLSPSSVPPFLYQSGLFEVSDCIVDVSPLESGYARDVLGRLSFVSTWNGNGWWGFGSSSSASNSSGRQKEKSDKTFSSICVNYRCDDSGMRVLRLRSS